MTSNKDRSHAPSFASRFAPAFISRSGHGKVAASTSGFSAKFQLWNYDHDGAGKDPVDGNKVLPKSERPERAGIRRMLNAPIASLAASADNTHVVLAGREILKILIIGVEEDTEEINIRPPGRANLSLSCNDVTWGSGFSKNTIATAATNGTVAIWDIGRFDSARFDRVMSEYKRAVNRVEFNPQFGQLLLSASQDGTMRLWDLRERSSSARLVMHGKSESVRDISFNPVYTTEFAAAFENGTVQCWDIRKANLYERKLNAHNGLALAVDWHPDGKQLASGGRDKVINVWNNRSESRKPVYSVQMIDPVARISWRPIARGSSQATQIAACGLLHDKVIHIWDLRRPFVASRVLEGHENVVTGIYWHSDEWLWSCSKDKSFMRHEIRLAPKPVDNLPHQAFGWSPNEQFAFAIQAKARSNRSKSLSPMSPKEDQNAYSRGGEEKTRFYRSLLKNKRSVESDIILFRPMQMPGIVSLPLFDWDSFAFCAAEYISYRNNLSSILDACKINATIADKVGKCNASQTWRILATCLDWQAQPDAGVGQSDNFVDNQSTRANNIYSPILISRNLSQTSISQANHTIHLPPSGTHSSVNHSRGASGSSQLIAAIKGNPVQATPALSPLIQSITTADLNPLESIDASLELSASKDSKEYMLSTSDEPLTSPEASVSRVSGKFLFHTGIPIDRPNSITTAKHNCDSITGDSGDQNHSKVPTSLKFCSYPWSVQALVFKYLESYADIGDVQMCSTLGLLFSDHVNISRDRLDEWILDYVEILQRHRLFVSAGQIIKTCKSERIRTLGQRDTFINLTCHRCYKAIFNEGGMGYWYCERCRKNLEGCVLCCLPVKGRYTACQGCNHGGHEKCLASWYKESRDCPSGCGHKCII